MAKEAPTLFSEFRALVIDDVPQMRGLLHKQLAQIGLRHVAQAGSGEEGLATLAREPFDVVLVDYNLGEGLSGQQVVERAKELKLVPDGTIWLMITAENGRDLVSISAEHVPDDYVLKPVSESILQARLTRALAKKKTMQDFYDALQRKDTAEALALARNLADSGTQFALEGTKQLGKLLLILGDAEGARQVYLKILAERTDQPFAALGLAKAYRAKGDSSKSKDALLELKAQYPELVGVYDELFEIYNEEGDSEKALEISQAAAGVVPSAKRLLTVGKLAMALGKTELAAASFDKATSRAAAALTTSIDDLALMMQAYVSHKAYKKALTLCSEPRPRFKEVPSYEVLLNAIRAQAYKGVSRHREADRAYDLCKDALAQVNVNKNCLQVCLAAAVAHGDYREIDRITGELARNNHDNPWLLRMVQALVTGTFVSLRVEELVHQECAAMQSAIQRILGAKTNDEHLAAIAAAALLLKRAPNSRAARETLAAALVSALRNPDAPVEIPALARSYLVEWDSTDDDAKNVAGLTAELRRALHTPRNVDSPALA